MLTELLISTLERLLCLLPSDDGCWPHDAILPTDPERWKFGSALTTAVDGGTVCLGGFGVP